MDIETATDAPDWVTVDVRVFYPPDVSPGLVAELLRGVCRQVLAELDNPTPAVVVELPPLAEEE